MFCLPAQKLFMLPPLGLSHTIGDSFNPLSSPPNLLAINEILRIPGANGGQPGLSAKRHHDRLIVCVAVAVRRVERGSAILQPSRSPLLVTRIAAIVEYHLSDFMLVQQTRG
jgi:hypothetical protein